MHSNERALLRVANAVSEQLANLGTPRVVLPDYRWGSIQKSLRRVNICRKRGWHFATTRVLNDLRGQMESMSSHLEKLATLLVSPVEIACPMSAHDIYRDLSALREEFGGVACDLKAETVSVTTDPIKFEEIELGAFEIQLKYRQLDQASPYRVIALKPNRPPSSGRVTHPHVLEDNLCEGHGTEAIRIALAEGRLYDFFLIVSRLLATYAEGSAHVELSGWYSHTCEDCGAHGDDIRSCKRCQAEVCSDCHTDCPSCRAILCGSCTAGCRRCQRLHCTSCLNSCSRCQARVCPDCRVFGVCPDCLPQESDNDEPTLDTDDEIDTESEPAVPEACSDPTVQPNGLGQTVVPA